ncbi:MAG: NADH-quinone oxidoreductase subunit K [Nitrososphaerota archaeon]|jgi:NADH-quinone oxidoreductase subunit K|nr:NADH-quinone oxidoreductase subunit K [Nitrososphaerota archaeon]MDG6927613.1 NADH-quinone oxidoreductase subunit K [Nitrososphaerota archaeon]MDG6929936.1 NADH-quinone oxidoreductase subunit K [Nitrososphaerota archaeon]MDG6931614.1 NADH-quinone oxidoreductase subunit K [Nitrososphaerota archaeon]MDG6935969.1 NADH-quinone oxidoreductase subunit K [Nitrososphaerota archaeon]
MNGITVILIAGVFVLELGIAGLVYNRNLVKMLLSLEVSFNGAILLVLYISWMLFRPQLAGSLVFFSIVLAIGEISIILSVLIYMFKMKMLNELDQDEIEDDEK